MQIIAAAGSLAHTAPDQLHQLALNAKGRPDALPQRNGKASWDCWPPRLLHQLTPADILRGLLVSVPEEAR